jgi:hypothetical protein
MTMYATGGAQALGRGQPSPRRLAAGAIVAGIGFVVLSVAFAGHVVSAMALPASQAADARTLAAVSPVIAVAGIVHLLVAAALAAGRDLFRIVAATATGIVAIAAGASAAMIAAGVGPFGGAGAHRVSASGVGIMAVAAALYGVAAIMAASESAEN